MIVLFLRNKQAACVALKRSIEKHLFWFLIVLCDFSLGAVMSYTNWDVKQGPDAGFFAQQEDCAVINIIYGGKWHDRPCTGLIHNSYYICQYGK